MAPLEDCETVAFIKEMQRHPVLWNVNHGKYFDKFCMAAAWKGVSHKLQIPEKTLKPKWKSLRDVFKREMNKYSKTTQEYTGQWKYFQNMAYLIENYLYDEVNINEDKDDGYPIEFIVEKYSEDQSSDELLDDDDDNYHNYSKTSKRKRKSKINVENDADDERVMFPDSDYENDNSLNYVPFKRKRTDGLNNDVMFLRSLAPYFKQLDPVRKLVMRSRIQNLLLKEIADQNPCSSGGQ